MIYRFERKRDHKDWFEMRDVDGVIEYRDFSLPQWIVWSNTQTIDTATKNYRESTEWEMTMNLGLIQGVSREVVEVIKHQCTCPWSGPTGVYAVGCKCNGA